MQNRENLTAVFHSLSHLSVPPGAGLVKPLPWDLKILLLPFFFCSHVALQSWFVQGADRNGAALLSGWGFYVCNCFEAFPLLITLNKLDQG